MSDGQTLSTKVLAKGKEVHDFLGRYTVVWLILVTLVLVALTIRTGMISNFDGNLLVTNPTVQIDNVVDDRAGHEPTMATKFPTLLIKPPTTNFSVYPGGPEFTGTTDDATIAAWRIAETGAEGMTVSQKSLLANAYGGGATLSTAAAS
jgi:hypothetical protein